MGYELLEDCSQTELMDMVIRLRAELKAARDEIRKANTFADNDFIERQQLKARIAELESPSAPKVSDEMFMMIVDERDSLVVERDRLKARIAERDAERRRDALEGQAALDEANNRIVTYESQLKRKLKLCRHHKSVKECNDV